ncbi:hypothetical protein CLOM_g6520 [Closterium sp. NIES-68]|nr:hypothetical protein CLOM_g6520 [Closterium sp. NIES-68]
MLDESTDRCRGKHLIVYAHFIRDNRLVCEYLALLTVDKADASSLLALLLTHLNAFGVDLQEALAAKAASEVLPVFQIVDDFIKELAEYSGRSGP